MNMSGVEKNNNSLQLSHSLLSYKVIVSSGVGLLTVFIPIILDQCWGALKETDVRGGSVRGLSWLPPTPMGDRCDGMYFFGNLNLRFNKRYVYSILLTS